MSSQPSQWPSGTRFGNDARTGQPMVLPPGSQRWTAQYPGGGSSSQVSDRPPTLLPMSSTPRYDPSREAAADRSADMQRWQQYVNTKRPEAWTALQRRVGDQLSSKWTSEMVDRTDHTATGAANSLLDDNTHSIFQDHFTKCAGRVLADYRDPSKKGMPGTNVSVDNVSVDVHKYGNLYQITTDYELSIDGITSKPGKDRVFHRNVNFV